MSLEFVRNRKFIRDFHKETITKTWLFIYIKILFKEKCFDIFNLIHWLRQSIPRLMIKKNKRFGQNLCQAIYVLKNTDFRTFLMTKN